MAAGFVLIPWLGTPATLCLAATLLFVCGMVWAPKTLAARASWGVMALIGVFVWQGRLYELPPVRTLLPVAGFPR